ncbi:MAG: hypothetical protein KTR31_34385 [Myxococcales bacterium]|nr:hypothetical protein [Myxococcales bacterium]
MDATGARFWSLSGPEDLAASEDPDRVAWVRGRLRLASQAAEPVLAESEPLAGGLREQVPVATDDDGSWTRIDTATSDELVAHHEGVTDDVVFTDPTPGGITGVAIDPLGNVTVAASGALQVRDSRTFGDDAESWRVVDVPALAQDPTLPFQPWRVAPRPDGGAWVLDRTNGTLTSWTGKILRRAPDRVFDPGVFRPDPETPETLQVQIAVRDGFDGDTAAGLATSPQGQVAVLGLRVGEEARIHLFAADGTLLHRFELAGVSFPYSIGFVGEDRIAVLATDGLGSPEGAAPLADALVYPLSHDDPRTPPVGDRYPLRRHDGDALWVAWDGRPAYGTASGHRTLRALSLPLRATEGRAAASHSLDSGRADTAWHRLQVEAIVPPGCGFRVLLAASDSATPPEDPRRWHPHDVGVVPPLSWHDRVLDASGEAVVWSRTGPDLQLWPVDAPPDADPLTSPVHLRAGTVEGSTQVGHTAQGTWVPVPSELPNHPGVLGCEPEVDRAGRFVALIQRTRRQSTRLVGRHLHVRLVLFGTGRATPEVAMVRAWGPRSSWVRRYLPELYHEHPQIEGSDDRGEPTQADFLERFVALFEGVMTPIEDRVTEAWQWTHPTTTPAEALDWLASWTGVVLDPALSEVARRNMIRHAPTLARWRGTLRGLQLAIEIATEGGVSRGDVVVLEDWRLRRTWATVLGADLTDDEDPLLLGLSVDTNSIVGDTLVLGEEYRQEFLALYSPDVIDGDAASTWIERIRNRRSRRVVERFFAASAHRVSVLLHDSLPEAQRTLVRALVEDGVPAHVVPTVRVTSRSFIVGVTALVQVDTRLGVRPAPEGAVLGQTIIGTGDRVQRPGGLHPDRQGGGA